MSSLLWVSCDKEVEINDDYKDITIVYGLINPEDSVSYIRIEKAFLSDGDIYQVAQIADSNIYPYKLDVKMIAEESGDIIEFDTVTIFNKDTGIFYAPKMTVYYAVTKDVLNTDDIYNLEINNPKNGDQISSQTVLVNGKRIHFSYPNYSINFLLDKTVAFKSISQARLYQLNIRFHYTEGLMNSGDTTFTEHYVDWLFPSTTSRGLTGGENMGIQYIGDEFYANLVNNIDVKGNVIRYSGQAELILSTADDVFNIYMEQNKPSTSIVIDRPKFTNIENGYGIFASRSNGGGFYNIGLTSQIKIRQLDGLNFIAQPVN